MGNSRLENSEIEDLADSFARRAERGLGLKLTAEACANVATLLRFLANERRSPGVAELVGRLQPGQGVAVFPAVRLRD